MLDGPRYVVHSNQDYDDLAKKTGAWYCQIPGAAPGGFSRPDDQPGGSWGDAIHTSRNWYIHTRTAVQRLDAGQPLSRDQRIGLRLHLHEFGHCVVPTKDPGASFRCLPDGPLVDWATAKRRYEHPDKAIPAIVHALSTGCQANAFTRLLRFR